MDLLILYTTDCPKCKILEKKLDEKNITYGKNYDINYMIEQGFTEAPVLQFPDGSRLRFNEAVSWVNLQ